MLNKIYKLTLCLLFTLILSALLTFGMMFIKYYEYYTSDLINPEKGFWRSGIPLFAATFLTLFFKTVVVAWVINSFRKNKLPFTKLLLGSSIVFFAWGLISNFDGIHYKRLYNLKEYMSSVDNMPSYQRNVSMEKVNQLASIVVTDAITKEKAIWERYLSHALNDDALNILIGKTKLENKEAYDDLILCIKGSLEALISSRQLIKSHQDNYLTEKNFKNYFLELQPLPELWDKVPTIYHEEIMSDGLFPSLQPYMKKVSNKSLDTLERLQELNEKYLYLANLLKENFEHYTVNQEGIFFENEALVKDYNDVIAKVQLLQDEINTIYETTLREDEEKRKAYIDKHITQWAFPPDYTTLLEKACVGDRNAQEEICGLIYKGVLRFPQNTRKMDKLLFDWLSEEQPQDSLQRKVARLFYHEGYVKDAEEIHGEIQDLANKEDMHAQRLMGSCLFYTDKLGKRDLTTSLEWYKKAAKQGHARAQLSLALRYLRGHHFKKNIEEGLKWLNKATEAGLSEAQYELAHLFLVGEHVPLNVSKGYKLLLLAAAGGDPWAQRFLARYHLETSDLLFPEDPNTNKGLDFLNRARKSGNLGAMYLFGLQLYEGKNLPKNQERGLKYITISAGLGYKKARRFLEKLEQSKSLYFKDKLPSRSKRRPNEDLSKAIERKDKSLKYYESLKF